MNKKQTIKYLQDDLERKTRTIKVLEATICNNEWCNEQLQEKNTRQGNTIRHYRNELREAQDFIKTSQSVCPDNTEAYILRKELDRVQQLKATLERQCRAHELTVTEQAEELNTLKETTRRLAIRCENVCDAKSRVDQELDNATSNLANTDAHLVRRGNEIVQLQDQLSALQEVQKELDQANMEIAQWKGLTTEHPAEELESTVDEPSTLAVDNMYRSVETTTTYEIESSTPAFRQELLDAVWASTYANYRQEHRSSTVTKAVLAANMAVEKLVASTISEPADDHSESSS